MRLRQILFAFVFIPLGGKHYRRIFITILDLLAFKRNAGDGNTKEICCFEMKDLRDIVPVYPQLKSWLAKKVITWRKIQMQIGTRKETRISNFQLNTIFDT